MQRFWQTCLVIVATTAMANAADAQWQEASDIGSYQSILSRAGYDLVEANALKTLVILGVTLTAVPVFIYKGQVDWLAAVVLAAGMSVGGYVGAKFAVEGGERVIRPVLVVSVLALAGRMVGLY